MRWIAGAQILRTGAQNLRTGAQNLRTGAHRYADLRTGAQKLKKRFLGVDFDFDAVSPLHHSM